MTHVIAFGTFDPLHNGHLHLFSYARSLGSRLTVIVSKDNTIRRVKQREPMHTETKRLLAVKACGIVDNARLGYEDDVYRVLSEEQPDIICLGYDQTHFIDKLQDELHNRNIHATIMRAPAHDPHIHKSTLLRQPHNETHK